jgi:hypothetical protein
MLSRQVDVMAAAHNERPSVIPAKDGIQVLKTYRHRVDAECVSPLTSPIKDFVQNSLLMTCPPLESLTGRPIGVSYSWVKSRPTRS